MFRELLNCGVRQGTRAMILLCVLLLGCGGDSGTPSTVQPEFNIQLTQAFPELPVMSNLLGLYQQPVSSLYWYAVLRTGEVLRFDNDPKASKVKTVLDISSQVNSTQLDAGLLGLAFHPDFSNNRQVYLYYTTGNPFHARVSRFSFTTDSSIDPLSEEVVLVVDKPTENHNGGTIAFGPDGYLYIGVGDGSGPGDPDANSQNSENLLGSLLRIDVDSGNPYSIPADNPFVDDPDILSEIYARGFRNPWRWSFDRLEGTLWLGDVGQSDWEEVNVVTKGANYGWNIMEGSQCFRAESCDRTNLVEPIAEYDHSKGKCSITGGYVYRGSNVYSLQGVYVYGDYCSGQIWGLELINNTYVSTEIADTSFNVSAFAEDNQGEVYVLAFSADAGESIFRIDWRRR